MHKSNNLLLLAFVLTFFGFIGNSMFAQSVVATNGEKQPDVVFILLDDLRWDALSCMGHPYVKTPHIDTLREQGALMENAFVTTSICCPSRATFVTGTYANQHGVIDNETSEYNPEVTPPLTKELQASGYTTAWIGKWHMGDHAMPRPYFDYWLSFKGQGVYHNPKFNINGDEISFKGYTTDLLTDKTIEFIDQHSLDKPYFVALSHKAVHEPFKPAARHKDAFGAGRSLPQPLSWVDDFKNKPEWMRRQQIRDYRWEWRTRELEADQVPESIAVKPWQRNTKYVKQLRCVSAVDDGVGRLIAALKKRGTLDNTLIVFTSDNGYFHMEHRRWDKRLAYEESLRIPMIIVYPNKIEPTTSVAGLVTNLDFAPTVLDYANVSVPEIMQGLSMRPLLEQENTQWRTSIFYEYWMDLVHSIPTMVAARTDRYKLIRYPDIDDRDELYDLHNDPHEINNLAGIDAHKALHDEMRQVLDAQIFESGWRVDVFPKNLPRYRSEQGTICDFTVLDGKLQDASNSDIHVVANDCTFSGNSMVFDGRGSGLKFGYNPKIDPASWPYVIELDFKADADGVLVTHAGPNSGYKIFLQDGRLGIAVLCRTWIATRTTIDASANSLGAWSTLRAVIDYNRLSLYLNGECVDSVALPQPFKAPVKRPLVLGAGAAQIVNKSVPNFAFKGAIKRVQIIR
ncbi:MAG: hypothetical protein CNC89_04890 [Puniceicoccaceae bacterium MED-G31]|nr:MAG: hypothetical protein CNC89_04890 [Puniceicoccaceae bacterium MED-G31]